MWALGLSAPDIQAIAQAGGQDHTIREVSLNDIPDAPIQGEEPYIIWISTRAYKKLPRDKDTLLNNWEGPQRVLVVGTDDNAPDVEADVEEALEKGYLSTIHAPLNQAKLHEIMHRAEEISRLYSDIFRMTREVLLERELLARKTDQLLFLNQILTRASQSLDPGTILNRAKEDMNLLFPVSALQAVFWNPAATQSIEAELLISPNATDASRQQWMDHLLENAVRLAAAPVKNFRLDLLPQNGSSAELHGPDDGETVVMPLRTGYEYFGCLALCSPKGTRLAKDQVQTMRSAINHLALALKNALLYTQAKTRAEYDGLTKIHNRASFDERLMEEVKRHQRHGHDFSLLMLDLDHFKRINDEYGHQAGDAVLRGIGTILAETLRASDFTARYGGEEFVVLLPQTTEDKAWLLAERIRKKIAQKHFEYLGKAIQVTVSIGAASLSPDCLSKADTLLRDADEALYRAKSGGRNMVCLSGKCESQAMMQQ
jgi:diguanylate cyclase (GGDEF)-like protein